MEKGHDSSHSTKEVIDPDDIFTKDGEAVKKIFMTGDSGRGKTTFCLWLLKNWCNALQKDCSDSKKLDKWEKKLKEFDFVFLLQLCDFQYIQTNIASVIDMICQVVFESDTDHHATIRHVLSSNQYRSLIIIDGLDEWNPNEETSKHLIYERMPKLDVSSTVSCFIAMRPWVLSTISKTVGNSDRVIEVFGLNEAGIEIVIKNVLVNRYKLAKDPEKCILDECNKIFQYFSEKKLKSFMQIPLLTVVCVQMLYEKKQLGDSMTSFYAEMLNMLIERANEKHIKLQEGQSSGSECDVPRVFCKHKTIQNYISVLLKLGELAYEGLISDKTSKVFEKIELGDEIRYFALNAGIISQKEASSRTEKKVSVHFFHKSIQEFLAVIYIVTNKEVSDSFRKHLSSVKVIMELSNVIMFICGMCPNLGSVISQHVISVTDSDIEICEYRESPGIDNTTVKKLYKLQVIWYRELQCGQIESPMVFNVSDIYLESTNSIETVMGTRELLHGEHVNIKSLNLWWVPIDKKSGITNAQVNNFLGNKDKTKSLTKVIICGGNGRTFHPISQPTHLRYLYLYNLKINNTNHYGNSCPELLKDMPLLRDLYLYDVTLNEKGLYLSANMVHIKMVMLDSVNMSAALWQQFILSVLNIQHRFNVKLWGTNIDDESKTIIRSLVDFSVTQDDIVKDRENEYKYQLKFTRVWPMSHTTQYDDDEEICTYRKSPRINNTTVEKLYELQVTWYRKLECGQTESPAVFNVLDIHLERHSCIDTVMETRELLHGEHVNIRSLRLWWVPIDEKSGITNAQLNNSLGNKDKTKSLTKVIICGDYGRILHPISQPTHLRYLHLHNLEISKSDHYGNVCPQLLKDMPLLRELYLYKVTLNEKGLYLSADMVHVKMVMLDSVNMSAALWQQFILSVLNIQHRFDVELWDTNIDDKSKSKIRSFVDFSVTQDGLVKDEMGMDDEYKYQLNFTRVWPLLHTTPYGDDGNEILYTRL